MAGGSSRENKATPRRAGAPFRRVRRTKLGRRDFRKREPTTPDRGGFVNGIFKLNWVPQGAVHAGRSFEAPREKTPGKE